MSAGAADKWALEAGTDQALAVARDNRDDPGYEGIAPLADWIAGIIAGQFPADRALAGRVLMAAAQMFCAAAEEDPGLDAAFIGAAVAFAAERVVREAGAT